MQLVPVLEIRHGKCVHTEPKNSYVDHVVRGDVLETVEDWVEKGIKRLHIVDVDAIESGEPENVDLVGKIKRTFPDLQLQVLGGVKCIESAYVWADVGVDFIVLNGRAMRQRDLLDDICVEFPERVLVEIDFRQGGIGSGDATFKFQSLARQLDEDGVVGLVVTEVPNFGHVGERNLTNIIEVTRDLGLSVFANGGISTLEELRRVLEGRADKLTGILIGKAIYNGFCLNEARNLIQQYHSPIEATA